MLSNDFTTHTCYIYSERTPKEPCLVQRCLLNMGSFHSKHGEKRLCLGFLFGSAYIWLSIHFLSTISQFRTRELSTFVFRPQILCFIRPRRRRNSKTQQSPVILEFCLRKLGQGNHVIIVTSSFSKSAALKLFSVHTKTKNRRFQIPLVLRRFRKVSLSGVTDIVLTIGLNIEINLRFQIPLAKYRRGLTYSLQRTDFSLDT